MSVLTQEEKELLNKLADSQPALNKPGVILGESQVRLGDAVSLGQSGQALKMSWSFAADGAVGSIELGKVPAGSIVTAVYLNESSAVDSTDASIALDGNDLVANEDLTASSGFSVPLSSPQLATDGVVTITFAAAPTGGAVEVILSVLAP